MKGSGGCCIARYSNGSVYDMSKVDKIMLKFRPIAPKPAAGGSLSGGSPPESTKWGSSKTGRGKRKYNKNSNKNNNNCNRKRKSRSEESESIHKTSSGDTVVTLSLLPERGESPKQKSESPTWIRFGSKDKSEPLDHRQVSVVVVESVTDTWLEVYGLGSNDSEKMVNLARDTYPGFISDGVDQVLWTNKAYGEMVGREGGEVIVQLVMKERIPITCDAFSCMVRLQSKGAVLVPCDVWRMDGGGFVWRLDVDAALSLSRYNV